ncbi:hypothetical protein MAL01_17105 [Leptospira noguchii]|uniref:hypothetical protein n=1 Tax=Leptospira noguchii TaxID=28182 RepID=UPI001FB759D1|nr:hypothetical protein [Leptospira noguchii]UOG45010.1 hypothetical protein MAL01_17105 [Leptospira noguchii]
MNELKQNALLNSASHSPWVVRQVALTQQNAFLNSMHRSLRVALQGRVNSAKRFLRKRFRVNKLNLKTIVVLCFLYAIY